jgi:hypothetical protein
MMILRARSLAICHSIWAANLVYGCVANRTYCQSLGAVQLAVCRRLAELLATGPEWPLPAASRAAFRNGSRTTRLSTGPENGLSGNYRATVRLGGRQFPISLHIVPKRNGAPQPPPAAFVWLIEQSLFHVLRARRLLY